MGRLDVFVNGTNNTLWQKTYDGQWQEWKQVTGAGSITSAPAAVSWSQGRIDVVARAADGRLRHDAWTGSAWVADFFDSGIEGSPTIASQGAGKLDIFYRKAGQADKLFKLTYDESWQTPVLLP